jgi:hypothetical protein
MHSNRAKDGNHARCAWHRPAGERLVRATRPRCGLANGSFSPPSLVFKSLQSEPIPLSRTQGLSFGSYCAPFCAPLLIQRQRNQADFFLRFRKQAGRPAKLNFPQPPHHISFGFLGSGICFMLLLGNHAKITLKSLIEAAPDSAQLHFQSPIPFAAELSMLRWGLIPSWATAQFDGDVLQRLPAVCDDLPAPVTASCDHIPKSRHQHVTPVCSLLTVQVDFVSICPSCVSRAVGRWSGLVTKAYRTSETPAHWNFTSFAEA